MSKFGDVEKFSGPVQVNEMETNKQTTKRQLGEKKSLTNVKGIIRPVFPLNDRSDKSFREIEATGVSMNGKNSIWAGFDFNAYQCYCCQYLPQLFLDTSLSTICTHS